MNGGISLQLWSACALSGVPSPLTEPLSVDYSEFSAERLFACATDHRELGTVTFVDHMVTTVREFRPGAEQNDDLTTLVLRFFDRNARRALRAEKVAFILQSRPNTVGGVHRVVRKFWQECEVADCSIECL